MRLVITDLDGMPLDDLPYALRADAIEYKGFTVAGLVDHELPPHIQTAELSVDNGRVTKQLRIGTLEPVENVRGIQARLRNLGYHCGPIDGVYGPLTTEGVRSFQRESPPLETDGDCGPKTQAVLIEKYGC